MTKVACTQIRQEKMVSRAIFQWAITPKCLGILTWSFWPVLFVCGTMPHKSLDKIWTTAQLDHLSSRHAMRCPKQHTSHDFWLVKSRLVKWSEQLNSIADSDWWISSFLRAERPCSYLDKLTQCLICHLNILTVPCKTYQTILFFF